MKGSGQRLNREKGKVASLERTTLYGDIVETGFTYNWCEISGTVAEDGEQSRGMRSLEFCFNLEGQGELCSDGERARFGKESMWMSAAGSGGVETIRHCQTSHRFLTLGFSSDFLTNNLPVESGNLHPVAKFAMQRSDKGNPVSEVDRLSLGMRGWVDSIRKPPVLRVARPLWYRAKALELASDLLFVGPKEELFCHRQQRLAEERANQVKTHLALNLTEPPSLKDLGRLVGCSPFHLSRTFSTAVGMTIPQYLRQIRIERAADLLREGRLNVTEVALEVGYNSISHFSQAFCQLMGCCPAMYPMKRK